MDKLEGADGIVGIKGKEGKLIVDYYVKENTVYELIKDSIIPVGFVKDGLAYRFMVGGRAMPIGPVKYKDQEG